MVFYDNREPSFYEPIDLSGCIREHEPIDVSNIISGELCNDNEVKFGQSIKEYYYYSGFTGPTGPTGPVGTNPATTDATFLNIFNTDTQQVHHNTAVIFNNNNSISGSCYHDERTSQIFIWKTGYYHVFTNIYHFEGCQFSLFKNSTDIIAGSTIGTISGTTQNSNTVIFPITSNDMTMDCSYSPTGFACSIELVNITPTIDSVILYDSSGLGFMYSQINSSITLFSLCN